MSKRNRTFKKRKPFNRKHLLWIVPLCIIVSILVISQLIYQSKVQKAVNEYKSTSPSFIPYLNRDVVLEYAEKLPSLKQQYGQPQLYSCPGSKFKVYWTGVIAFTENTVRGGSGHASYIYGPKDTNWDKTVYSDPNVPQAAKDYIKQHEADIAAADAVITYVDINTKYPRAEQSVLILKEVPGSMKMICWSLVNKEYINTLTKQVYVVFDGYAAVYQLTATEFNLLGVAVDAGIAAWLNDPNKDYLGAISCRALRFIDQLSKEGAILPGGAPEMRCV